MLNFTVQKDRCTRCGLCVLDCPSRIIKRNAEQMPYISGEDEENCLQCQHCLAICPTAAISILGFKPENSLLASGDSWPSFEQMDRFMRGRRSVRQYADQNVKRELIDQLLATVANAPTGVNSRSLTFTVIDDKSKLNHLRQEVMKALVEASEAGKIPPRLSYIEKAIDAYVEHRADVVFRGAPHVLIVSAPAQAPCAMEDVPIALAYFELLAQSAGLGTVWCGLLKLALETAPELKKLVDLPPDHHYYAMLFGRPAIRYARTVQRDSAAVIKRPTL